MITPKQRETIINISTSVSTPSEHFDIMVHVDNISQSKASFIIDRLSNKKRSNGVVDGKTYAINEKISADPSYYEKEIKTIEARIKEEIIQIKIDKFYEHIRNGEFNMATVLYLTLKEDEERTGSIIIDNLKINEQSQEIIDKKILLSEKRVGALIAKHQTRQRIFKNIEI